MRKLLIALAVLAGVALLLPSLNLLRHPASPTLERWGQQAAGTREIAALLENSCANCHTTEGVLPAYAHFPVAKGIVHRDIAQGLHAFDLTTDLVSANGTPAPEAILAKVEHEILRDQMPPARYKAMHWTSHLHDGEKAKLLAWIRNVRAQHYADAGVPERFRGLTLQPLPATVAVDVREAALGEKLYHDVRLSADNSLSCASCHDLAKGGTDRERVSRGIAGQRGTINAPTTFNAGFQSAQFWDGRAASLEDQAGGPPNNPVEMGSNWPQIIGKLAQDPEFVREFRAVYPEGLSPATISHAIAEFERTLVTPGSRFDRYLLGEANALTLQEQFGYRTFLASGCQSCHVGKLLGGQSFELMGRRADYFGDRGGVSKADWGRYNATLDPRDRYRFKVPTLRNVTATAPYLHDGSTSDLRDVVAIMAKYQAGVKLTQPEIDAVAAFLGTLTGEYRGRRI